MAMVTPPIEFVTKIRCTLFFILPVNVALRWLYGILVSNSFNVLVPVVVFHSCNTSGSVCLPFHKHLSTWRFL